MPFLVFSQKYIGLGIIIPIDELIFFRGVAQPPTSICILLCEIPTPKERTCDRMLTCILTFDLANFKRHIMFLISIHHWIGLRENLQENVRFHGEMDCFRLFFFLKPIQSIQRIGPVVTVVTVVCHLPRQFLPCRILSYRRSAMVHQSQKTASSTVDFRRCPLVVSQPRQILKYIEIY